MPAIRIVPLDSDRARALRARRVDDFGNSMPVRRMTDGGYPCRHCLQDIDEGSDLLLLAYSPFPAPGPYSEVGPIFICAGNCTAYRETDRLPGIVTDRLVTVRAYDGANEIIYGTADVVDGAEAQGPVERLLARPDTAYVHIRTARNGCFLCEVRRAA